MNAASTNHHGLIPRRLLFGNPSRTSCTISPDGHRLAWIAPDAGVLNVWVAPRENLGAARPVTRDRGQGIGRYFWSFDDRSLLYLQDRDGDENDNIFAVDLDTGETRNLTPFPDAQVRLVKLTLDRPGEIAVAVNDRDPKWHDLWRIDIASGERALIHCNIDGYGEYVLDSQLTVRLASKERADGGGHDFFRLDGDTVEPWLNVPSEDDITTEVLEFDRSGRTLYLVSSIGRDRAALIGKDWTTGAETVLAEHPRVDLQVFESVTWSLVTGTIDAIAADDLRRAWIGLSPATTECLARLGAQLDGELFIHSRTYDDRLWVVSTDCPTRHLTYYLYDRADHRIHELFAVRPELVRDHTLARMYPQVVRARDGLELVSYLTLPTHVAERSPARPDSPVPLVLLVHGGPWARDFYGYSRDQQWLADRGYAVLRVNFRGSTGFGKAFVNAGDHEWGAKMHDDLIDAVEWAIREGIAPRDRIAIMGMSYGGYATLVGLTFTPDVFCCGIDVVGMSNLLTDFASIPPYWAAGFERLARREGDPRTEEGRRMLMERSPINRVDAIEKPLLIGHGASDPRVAQAESEQIVAAMKARGLPATYVLYPDEGHGFLRPENELSFFSIAEAFLAQHLGGRAEPIGSDLEGSSAEIREGAELVPGLSAALVDSARPTEQRDQDAVLIDFPPEFARARTGAMPASGTATTTPK